mmetsp:Transcript_3965/g.8799  ORF Transcript_3965/g.8799 Transcript_3965/m.8799 type:complete len:207 (-) Transcript_3965:1255-1875(-)
MDVLVTNRSLPSLGRGGLDCPVVAVNRSSQRSHAEPPNTHRRSRILRVIPPQLLLSSLLLILHIIPLLLIITKTFFIPITCNTTTSSNIHTHILVLISSISTSCGSGCIGIRPNDSAIVGMRMMVMKALLLLLLLLRWYPMIWMIVPRVRRMRVSVLVLTGVRSVSRQVWRGTRPVTVSAVVVWMVVVRVMGVGWMGWWVCTVGAP